MMMKHGLIEHTKYKYSSLVAALESEPAIGIVYGLNFEVNHFQNTTTN